MKSIDRDSESPSCRHGEDRSGRETGPKGEDGQNLKHQFANWAEASNAAMG